MNRPAMRRAERGADQEVARSLDMRLAPHGLQARVKVSSVKAIRGYRVPLSATRCSAHRADLSVADPPNRGLIDLIRRNPCDLGTS